MPTGPKDGDSIFYRVGQDGDPTTAEDRYYASLQPRIMDQPVSQGPDQADQLPGTAAFRAAIAGDQVTSGALRIIRPKDRGLGDRTIFTIRPDRLDKLNIVELPITPFRDEKRYPSDLILVNEPDRRLTEDYPLPPARRALAGVDFPAAQGNAGIGSTATNIGKDGPLTDTGKFPPKSRLGDQIALRLGEIGAGDWQPGAAIQFRGLAATPASPAIATSAPRITDVTDNVLGLGHGERLTKETYTNRIIPERPLRITEPRRLPGSGRGPAA